MGLWGRKSEKVLRLTRQERKDLRARAREDAELAARIQRAQRRLAQATGPLPVIEPREPWESAPVAPSASGGEQPARRSTIVDH